MKIQCDVCGGASATVFCCADEAALCDGCDRRVHHANKLAGKHRRFSLIDSPSSSPPPPSGKADPLCDVCKERRGFVFCQEDRAILCRDCDDPIHSANDLTMRHNRFLLTGVRLSTAPITPSPSSSSPESNSRSPGDEKVVGNTNSKNSTANAKQDKNLAAEGSSISEYLTKVCPGWHVEDLLIDGDDIVVGGFSKEKELTAFQRADPDGSSGSLNSAGATEFPKWAPLVPQLPPLPSEIPAIRNGSAGTVTVSSQWTGPKELSPSYDIGERVGRERWSVDDAVTVPQISLAPSSKRTRTPVCR
ncbi:B-box zinc finger protein 20-like isoform X2 [Ananas comosus]|uniref:B-box zinc finger protein 20-like isoform X2 n=1 Tax=Ananas comosus TaxID=4615 RepID=A0A6P5E9J5_ANACO|nr:B-box zinc finger protein 20-like isoform X2 [Ananas comosus]